VFLSVYKFAGAGATPVTPLMKPALETSRSAVEQMIPSGGTPIGEAVKMAQQDLDASGFSRRHVLVVTDGENTEGVAPIDVAKAINRLPEEHRSAVYVIAFDVAAATFKEVKEAGWMVLPASNAGELKRTLDILIGEKILLEK
jgi:Mg-chelatase subunit ChlD